MDIIRRDTNSKSCPKGYRKLDANGLCIRSERMKEGSFELPTSVEKCPKGFSCVRCTKTTKKDKGTPAKKTVKKTAAKTTKKTVKKRETGELVQLAADANRCPQG